MSRVAGNPQ